MKRTRASTFLCSSAVALLAASSGHVSCFAPIAPSIASARHSSSRATVPFSMVSSNELRNEAKADVSMVSSDTNTIKQHKNPTPVLVSAIQNMIDDGSADKITITNENKKGGILSSPQKIGMQLVAAAMAFSLAFLPLNNADAAMSGGRMGGSFSAPSRSRSMPSRSSYGGGGYSRGYSSPGYSSRTTIIAPGIGGYGYSPFGYSPFGYSPFISPFSPFTPRIFGGPGVISYARGPSFFDLLFVGGFMFAAANIFLRSANNAMTSSSSSSLDWSSVGGSSAVSSALGPGTSVVQVSVALEVPNRDDRNSILSVLDRLAQSARTDSRVGVQDLSSQVALELLRRRSSIVSASSSYEHFGDRNKALREFQSRSVKERSKFETETVSQYGGVDYGVGSDKGIDVASATGKATMAVVTLVLAIDGDSTKVPRINNVDDLEKALRKISTDAKVDDCLQSAEILWTPTERYESLSPRDVVADYPELRSI